MRSKIEVHEGRKIQQRELETVGIMDQGLDRAENIAWKARGGLSGSTFTATKAGIQ
jgi:hypothetical protein